MKYQRLTQDFIAPPRKIVFFYYSLLWHMSNFSQLVLEKMMLTVFSIKAHWKLQTDMITVLHLYLAVVLFWRYWQTLPKAPNIDTANISQVRRYRNLISTSIYRWSHSTIMFYYKLINTFTLLKLAINS